MGKRCQKEQSRTTLSGAYTGSAWAQSQQCSGGAHLQQRWGCAAAPGSTHLLWGCSREFPCISSLCLAQRRKWYSTEVQLQKWKDKRWSENIGNQVFQWGPHQHLVSKGDDVRMRMFLFLMKAYDGQYSFPFLSGQKLMSDAPCFSLTLGPGAQLVAVLSLASPACQVLLLFWSLCSHKPPISFVISCSNLLIYSVTLFLLRCWRLLVFLFHN